MMRFVVLGGYGIIGRVVVDDLVRFTKNAEIIIAGRNLEKAESFAKLYKLKRVKALKIDIEKKSSLIKILKNADVCINCLHYYFNLQIMRACFAAKVNYIDLGGMFHTTKKQLKLNSKFKKIKRLALLGCGSAPGITNILTAYGADFLKRINSVEILFADKDETKYDQKFVLPYSFKTLVDEYTLKPVILKKGKLKTVPPLSGLKEYIFDGGFGKQKGFLTLHSEIATLPSFLKNKKIKNMEFRVTFKEDFNKVIETLIKTGFTSKKKILVNKNEMVILDITNALMDKFVVKPKTKVKDSEILRVIFNKGRIIIDAVTNSTFNIPAGTYNTGVPCSILAQMIANRYNLREESGVYAPEKVINPKIFFMELKKRGILVFINKRVIN